MSLSLINYSNEYILARVLIINSNPLFYNKVECGVISNPLNFIIMRDECQLIYRSFCIFNTYLLLLY
jgi:hypothetical protein